MFSGPLTIQYPNQEHVFTCVRFSQVAGQGNEIIPIGVGWKNAYEKL
jgi:hypothetical protein